MWAHLVYTPQVLPDSDPWPNLYISNLNAAGIKPTTVTSVVIRPKDLVQNQITKWMKRNKIHVGQELFSPFLSKARLVSVSPSFALWCFFACWLPLSYSNYLIKHNKKLHTGFHLPNIIKTRVARQTGDNSEGDTWLNKPVISYYMHHTFFAITEKKDF